MSSVKCIAKDETGRDERSILEGAVNESWNATSSPTLISGDQNITKESTVKQGLVKVFCQTETKKKPYKWVPIRIYRLSMARRLKTELYSARM